MTLNANILFSLVANETDAGDYAKDVRTTKVETYIELTDGTGANQAQIAWGDKGTIAPSSNIQINSSPGLAGIADERGSLSFSAIKSIYVKNTGSAGIFFFPQDFEFGAPLPEVTIQPGGSIVLVNPTSAGSNTSGGTIAMQNQSTAVSASYEIVLIGEGTIT